MLDSIFRIALFPFTSGTFFVLIPCACMYLIALVGIVFRLVKGDYRGSSI